MFISSSEKAEISQSIANLKSKINLLQDEIESLKKSQERMAAHVVKSTSGKKSKAKKPVDPVKQQAELLRRREYARLYAQRKKQEKLQASLASIPATTQE